ncbi:MAG: hypothetical protein KatS3mg108_2097 [Isosphaeraceae bacterium]|jgi:4-amino-4-deoxy-L-arabinose transferase-like glycosyltransferase|nr:MAG: hypothetical protein KatS3mg108_2097 [Isosphaeraceae bacterium]
MRSSPPTETPGTGLRQNATWKTGRIWLGGTIVAIVAIVSAASGLTSEPVFPDETAYVTQSYYFDLMIRGERDDWAWVEYHAYDLPPLPKYLFGAALRALGRPVSDRLTAGRWFRDIEQELVPRESVVVARWPVVFFAVMGCLGLYCLGTLGVDVSAGLAAGLLLAINPLYRLHAHRAMSDVVAESLVIAALATGLAGWMRLMRGRAGGGLGWMVVAGVAAGLAPLAKLSGLLAGMVLAAWLVLGWVLRPQHAVAWVGAGLVVSLLAVGTFVVLNPYVTARPTGEPPRLMMGAAAEEESPLARLERMIRHRAEVSQHAKRAFPEYALWTPVEKLAAVVVQGLGRFGPLGPADHDSRVPYPRFAWSRDWGAAPWGLAVVAGMVVLVRRGRMQWRSGEPATGWAIVVMALVVFGVVTSFLPLAWDRYYLPLQPAAALLGGAALTEAARRITPLPRGADRD